MSKINVPLSNQKICNALGVAEDDVLLYKELHKFDTVEQLLSFSHNPYRNEAQFGPLGFAAKRWRQLHIF